MKLFRNILILSATIFLVACDNNEQEKPDANLTIDSSTISLKANLSELRKTHIIEKYYIKGIADKNTTDTLFAYIPKTNDETMECIDSSCTTWFRFTDTQFPDFSQVQSLGGVLGNAGDLDDDGICELYFVADWFTSNWADLSIYSLKKNKWTRIASGSVRRNEGEEEDSLFLPYEKRIIKQSKGNFEILENVMIEDGTEKLISKKLFCPK